MATGLGAISWLGNICWPLFCSSE